MSNSSGILLDIDFSEKSGATAEDKSRYGNDGTVYGALWSEHGMWFDGTDDYISFPTLTIDTNYTLCGWYYPTSFSTYPHLWSSGVTFKYIRFNNTGTAIQGETATNADSFTLNYNFLVNKWYHIVIVGSTPNVISLYVNGVFADSDTVVDPTNIINKISYSGSRQFAGTIDEVRIYNHSLNASEIKSYYDSTKHRYL